VIHIDIVIIAFSENKNQSFSKIESRKKYSGEFCNVLQAQDPRWRLCLPAWTHTASNRKCQFQLTPSLRSVVCLSFASPSASLPTSSTNSSESKIKPL